MQIAVFGDSLVHGGIDTEKGGWVTRLRLHCMNSGLGDHVFAFGIGGNTSAHVLMRFEDDIRARLGRVDLVLFSVGLNDLAEKNGVSAEEYRANLRRLGARAVAHGKRVGFLGLTPRLSESADRHSRFDAIIEEVCREGGYLHIDMEGVVTPEDLVDTVHPGPSGHRKICERVIGFLLESKPV
jgi:lysophospholipase L1-like esterase